VILIDLVWFDVIDEPVKSTADITAKQERVTLE
jgi:hypothetical protein